MHVHFLDPYRPKASPIHQLDARIKLVLAIAFIVVTTLTPVGAWPIYILLFAVMLSVEIASELGVGYVLKRAMLAAPFILAAVPLLFTVDGTPIFSVAIGPWTLTMTWQGVERFVSIAIRSWLAVQMAIVLASTTTFPDLLMAMRALKVPRILVAVFGLMWRYLFVMVDEVGRLLRARAARSGHSSDPTLKTGGSLRWRAQVAGGMAGNLFIRSIERGDHIYAAMIARGYDGEIRGFPLHPIRQAQWVVLAIGLGLLVLIYLLGVLLAA